MIRKYNDFAEIFCNRSEKEKDIRLERRFNMSEKKKGITQRFGADAGSRDESWHMPDSVCQ